MDEVDDKGRCGEGKPQASAEQRASYEVAVALVQTANGPACTRSAAHAIMLKAFKKGRVAVFYPAKLIRRHPPYIYGVIYDHPTSFSPIDEKTWKEGRKNGWKEDEFTWWLPSVEAAFGDDPTELRQPTGEPWTAENTEWQLDELLSALSDPTINPFATLKAAAHSPLHQEVHDPGDLPAHAVLTEPAPAGQATPTPRRKNPRRPAIPIDLIGPNLREMDANDELPRDNAKLTAERLSAWLADKHPDRVAKPNGIRNNEEFKAIYDELTTVER